MRQVKHKINKVVEKLLIFIFGIMVINVIWQIFARHILINPSSFTDELARYSMIWLGILGAAYVSGRNEHVSIDYFSRKLSSKYQKIIHKCISLSIIIFSALKTLLLIVVTKFINQVPTTYDPSQYVLSFSGTTAYLNFTGSNIPESGSKVVVSKWTKEQVTEHLRARANWSTSSGNATYKKYQVNDLANNQVYVDVTTGTGFVQFVTNSEKTALSTANASDSINLIDEPTAIKPASTYGTFLGEHTAVGHTVRAVEIDANLKIDLDTPEQAVNLSNFVNKKRGQSISRVASNIEIFTEASYPRYLTNQYVASMKKATLTNSTTDVILEYPVAETNVYKIDYSLKLGSEFRAGTIHITTDGTDTVINDSHVETASTSDVTFSAALSSSKLQFKYTNANASNANLSYKIERWLQE